MSNDDKARAAAAQLVIDDEPDDWDKRIYSTGCAGTLADAKPEPSSNLLRSDENAKLTDCYYEKKDWRACKQEMEIFRQCWQRHGNDKRTASKDA
ncbi:CHCH domain-containing protein [Pyrenophora tritici-repentis]|uniref:CHCH domain-containing protein n=1 Tax=Pyrenophora tritici-repentis TaxID=45151 RepID=A0A2W1E086_9PLEO|nr:CHCH domain-containing protein [Pyrenophora tritici-repentis]KAF7566341.1 CHCH domain-containing protein [Pyrenophora tritici-repentis]KAG9379676.1 CHCH domain-containing protein [Pyrenophora tritici-repentis]KAI0571348.1 CHCH domain-containing protein [Pyrenophora tritici-repentis]KAI0577456.1 CHCH domain-containing protein [Pyrenophora tritici-repentis]